MLICIVGRYVFLFRGGKITQMKKQFFCSHVKNLIEELFSFLLFQIRLILFFDREQALAERSYV